MISPSGLKRSISLSELSNDNPINGWSKDIEFLLDKLRKNCVVLSHHHKKYYVYLKYKQKLFRIPIIIFGALNSVFSMSLKNYTEWSDVIICGINLIIMIVTSIEIFLGIQKGIENNYNLQREYYLLSISIYKQLELKRDNRMKSGNVFIDDCFDEYHRLVEQSNISNIEDKLTPLTEEEMEKISPTNSEIHNDTGV